MAPRGAKPKGRELGASSLWLADRKLPGDVLAHVKGLGLDHAVHEARGSVFDIPLGRARVPAVHWKGFLWIFVVAQPVEPKGGRSEVQAGSLSKRRQSDEPAYIPDPRSINVLLRPARSPATQRRQAPSQTAFPPPRATT